MQYDNSNQQVTNNKLYPCFKAFEFLNAFHTNLYLFSFVLWDRI